jgi:methylated-DNA-[protein]-cysteine S-methyltransferase
MQRQSFSVLGHRLTVVADGDTVVQADFSSAAGASGRLPASITEAIEAYLAGDCDALGRVPVRQPGTVFLQAAWAQMCAIDPGSTVSYGELAERIGSPRGSRAVGQACARNAIVLFVPCHRVVAAQGIGHYQYGSDFKAALLDHEARSR